MYIGVFVCFTSQKVLLELVTDLSLDSFLLFLKRFIGRGGTPEKIYCYNTSNFVRTSRELRKAREELLKQAETFTANKGTKFIFIPLASASWEKQLVVSQEYDGENRWQHSVESGRAKDATSRYRGDIQLSPICPVSSVPNNGEALTPVHLLIRESLRTLLSGSREEESGTGGDGSLFPNSRTWKTTSRVWKYKPGDPR